MPNKLTDTEVKKALECCANLEACEKCPMASLQKYDSDVCEHQIMLYAFNIINRLEGENEKNENIIRIADKTIESLKAEVERLKEDIKILRVSVEQAPLIRKDGKSPLSLLTAEIKAEACKEIAESIQGEIDDAIHSNYNAKEERQAKCKKFGIPIDAEDSFLMYCDGKIKALSGINSYIDNLLNELVGDKNGN